MDFGSNSPSRENNNNGQRSRRRESNHRSYSPPRNNNSIYGSNSNNDSNDNSSSVFSTMYNPMFELMRKVSSRDDQDGRRKSNDEEWLSDLRKK